MTANLAARTTVKLLITCKESATQRHTCNLKPDDEWVGGSIRTFACSRVSKVTQEESLPNLLSAGMWASESSLGRDTVCPLHSHSRRHHSDCGQGYICCRGSPKPLLLATTSLSLFMVVPSARLAGTMQPSIKCRDASFPNPVPALICYRYSRWQEISGFR